MMRLPKSIYVNPTLSQFRIFLFKLNISYSQNLKVSRQNLGQLM